MRNAELIWGIMFLSAGILSLICSVYNIDWFFKTSNASIFVKKLGRTGARLIYGITGASIIIFSILLLCGKIIK